MRFSGAGFMGRGRQGFARTHTYVYSAVRHWGLRLPTLQVLTNVLPSCPYSCALPGRQEGHPPQGGEPTENTVQPASRRLERELPERASLPQSWLPKYPLIMSHRQISWQKKEAKKGPGTAMPALPLHPTATTMSFLYYSGRAVSLPAPRSPFSPEIE